MLNSKPLYTHAERRTAIETRARNMMSMTEASRSRFCACSQALLEPILADIARERGGDLSRRPLRTVAFK